jgi:hypothetical protein
MRVGEEAARSQYDTGETMSEARPLNRMAAKQNPESVFSTPFELADEILLTTGEKLATLERWRLGVIRQLDAANEGMATRGFTIKQLKLLEEIEEAKRLIKDRLPPNVARRQAGIDMMTGS